MVDDADQQKLIFLSNSSLKPWPWDNKTLTDKDMQPIYKKKGDEIDIQESFIWEGTSGKKQSDGFDGDDHVCILTTGGDRFFVYGHHCAIQGNDADNDPSDEPTRQEVQRVPIIDRGRMFNVPGIGRVGTKDKISKHFRWYEFTKNGSRIPQSAAIAERLIKLAFYMDEVRAYLGDRPISTTSAYRPPQVNRRVGGSSKSRHIQGDAVDFDVRGMSPVEAFLKLKKFHGSRGGLAAGRGFVHIDLAGAPARRWLYPNGPKVDLW